MKKKAASILPSDDFTPTYGSNYGLDGYQFSEPYGEAVLDKARLPSSRGLSSLPDGFTYTKIEDEPVDLSKDAELDPIFNQEDLPVPDVDWGSLDNVAPKEEPIIASPEVAEFLKNSSETYILNPVNKDLKDFNYRRSLEPSYTIQNKSLEDLLEVIKRAGREASAGVPFENILQNIINGLGSEAYRVKEALEKLKSEKDLVGNVFIRSAFYPNCDNGTWSDQVKKSCNKARYIIDKPECSNCVHCKESGPDKICHIFGKIVVNEVPWKQALNYYLPQFGVKTASKEDPKDILVKLFSIKKSSTKKDTYFPTHKPALRFAKKILEIKNRKDIENNIKIKKLAKFLNSLKKFGRISSEQANHILNEFKEGKLAKPYDKIANIISGVQEREYTGPVFTQNISKASKKYGEIKKAKEVKLEDLNLSEEPEVVKQNLEETLNIDASNFRSLGAPVEDPVKEWDLQPPLGEVEVQKEKKPEPMNVTFSGLMWSE